MLPNSDFIAMLQRSRFIYKHPRERGVLSRGQLIAVALVLNRPEWLAEEQITLADAIWRLDRDELEAVVFAATHLHDTAIG